MAASRLSTQPKARLSNKALRRDGRGVWGIRLHGRVVCFQSLWNTRFMRGSSYKRVVLQLTTFVIAVLAVPGRARGDEFHLKDGSKIVGTIVSYEDGAFKVQTSYGFAYVRKDSIAEIVPTEKKSAPDSGQQSAALKPAGFAPAAASSKSVVQPMPRPIPKSATAASKPSSATGAVTNVAPPAVAARFPSLLPPDLSALLPLGEALDPRAQPMQEIV